MGSLHSSVASQGAVGIGFDKGVVMSNGRLVVSLPHGVGGVIEMLLHLAIVEIVIEVQSANHDGCQANCHPSYERGSEDPLLSGRTVCLGFNLVLRGRS